MWEERFQTPDYVFGKEPSRFIAAHADHLIPGGRALSLGDGEGRNSVFMAQRGMSVTALELAPSAIAKAADLATERGVSLDLRQLDILASDWMKSGDQPYDIVAGLFIQFTGPVGRRLIFNRMKEVCTPGGLVMLHGFTPEQIALGTGGPPNPENMYTEVILRGAFPGWEVLECRAYRADQGSGSGHVGEAALIDFIARKPG